MKMQLPQYQKIIDIINNCPERQWISIGKPQLFTCTECNEENVMCQIIVINVGEPTNIVCKICTNCIDSVMLL